MLAKCPRYVHLNAKVSADLIRTASRSTNDHGPAQRTRVKLILLARGEELSVYKTDNKTRVRDGYISLSTRGHARARQTRCEDSICRRNVTASARPCPPVRPLNLHGKEGVSGSSPEEGSCRSPAKVGFLSSSTKTLRPALVRDRYIGSRSGSEKPRFSGPLNPSLRDPSMV